MKRDYVDSNKQRWQRVAQLVAWDRLLPVVPVALRKVVYLDTRQALQTVALLRRGYRPENLLACNRKPVEIASLTQRLDRDGLPRVLTTSGEFGYWPKPFGAAHIVDFDGTSNIRGDVAQVLLTNAAFAATPRVLSFTILVGREDEQAMRLLRWRQEDLALARIPGATSSGQSAESHHWHRLLLCAWNATAYRSNGRTECMWHIRDWAWGIYRSTSRQTMAWMALRIVPCRSDPDPGVLLQTRPQWLIRGMLHGFVPACVNHRILRLRGQPADAVLARGAAFPSWSDEQFAFCGFDAAEAESCRSAFPSAPRCVGWPSRHA